MSFLFGGSSTNDLKQAQNQALLASGTGQQLNTTGLGLLTQGGADLNTAASYFKNLLGSRADEMSALSPQISSVIGQYDANRKAQGQLAPRGGGATAANAAAKSNEIGNIGNILASGRTAAASGLAGIGGTLAGTGVSAAGTGVSALGTSGNLYTQGQTITDQESAALGQGIGSILAQMFPNALQNTGKAISSGVGSLFS